MFSVSLSFGTICLMVLATAVSSQPAYLLPRQSIQEVSLDSLEPYQGPNGALEYQYIDPVSDYAIAPLPPTELSIMDYVFSPFTAVVSLGSTALSIVSWVVTKSALVFLGMAIVIGFCAFTSYCTLTIEKPSFLARENLSALPYLEDLEYYFNEAYNKYQEMQNSI